MKNKRCSENNKSDNRISDNRMIDDEIDDEWSDDRRYDERISNIEFELKKQKQKERMENNMPGFMNKPYKIPAY